MAKSLVPRWPVSPTGPCLGLGTDVGFLSQELFLLFSVTWRVVRNSFLRVG